MKKTLSLAVLHVSLSKAARFDLLSEQTSFSISFPSPRSLCLLQMGRRPRGLHYKQQIKGLPLIRCQGQRGGFACLCHDTISVNLLRSWIKRNQSIGRRKKWEKRYGAKKELKTRTKRRRSEKWVWRLEHEWKRWKTANMLIVHLS